MKIYDRDDYKLVTQVALLGDEVERIERNARESQELADALQSAGYTIDPAHLAQLSLVLMLGALSRGKWQEAREHSLTLAELLPDYPPSLAVLFR